ncbi:hypothetical protein MPSEU_000033300 [Mayamaea pseudoterrestris]|nr:hypothetical protein MPSEU_000033300 [Mayamaea pseudoterrestris]
MTPINPLYTSQELETVLVKSRSSILIVHASKLNVALETVKNCPRIEHIIVVTDDQGEAIPEGAMDLTSVIQQHRDHQHVFDETIQEIHHKTDTHPYLLPYSSGTTGQPKGVCLTHANIVANLLQVDQAEGLAFAPNHTLISPLPFFHIYAFTVSMLYCAWKGQKVVTMSKRFDLETFCQLVETHKPERAHLVPPILIQLAKNKLIDKYDISSLQMIMSAAAPLSLETEKAVTTRLNCQVKQGWGMSELSPIGTINSDFNIKSGSIGPLVSSTVGKIVDPNGKSLGPNEHGELMIHGPQVMLGYLDDPEKTLECLSPSRWLRTGDVGYYDSDGFFYLVDRIKELIKVRGYPVAPAELESLLLTHESVADCAVIPKPDDESGELPRAYIVLNDGTEATSTIRDEIYDWVKERVAPFKRLDGGIVFVDAVPKSASGKILRRILRDQLKVEMEATSQ